MSNVELQDELGLVGTLEILKIDASGVKETLFVDENLIMDRAKAHLLSLIYDISGTAETDPVASFKVGSGGVFNSNSTSVKPSDPKAVDLYTPYSPGPNSQFYNAFNITHNRSQDNPSFLSSSFPTDVTFTFNLTPNDLVGSEISEVGLFTESTYMFNHKTFPSIQKTSQFSLQFTWTIKYN